MRPPVLTAISNHGFFQIPFPSSVHSQRSCKRANRISYPKSEEPRFNMTRRSRCSAENLTSRWPNLRPSIFP